jgi:transposase
VYLEVEIRRVACLSCGLVKQEKLAWIADNPLYTKRFAFFVGRRCRASTLKDVAKELLLDWQTVKRLEMQYMREQLRRAGMPGLLVTGIDEISVKKGQEYRIVVSDLLRRRAIWFGRADRKEASMDLFYGELGAKKSRRIRLAVIDMWKAFQSSAARNAPQASILFDKFHVMEHLGTALDEVRKSESTTSCVDSSTKVTTTGNRPPTPPWKAITVRSAALQQPRKRSITRRVVTQTAESGNG